jgi:hypothetical protein
MANTVKIKDKFVVNGETANPNFNEELNIASAQTVSQGKFTIPAGASDHAMKLDQIGTLKYLALEIGTAFKDKITVKIGGSTRAYKLNSKLVFCEDLTGATDILFSNSDDDNEVSITRRYVSV